MAGQNAFENQHIYTQTLKNPRVSMAIRIGIAGHRHLTPEQCATTTEQVANTFSNIAQVLSKIIAPSTDPTRDNAKLQRDIANTLYDIKRYPKPTLRVTSSLATGADRIAMHSAFLQPFARDFTVQRAAIIPFAKDTYANDFTQAASCVSPQQSEQQEYEGLLNEIAAQPYNRLIELDGDYTSEATRDMAYYHCAKVLVENCDVLIIAIDESRQSSAAPEHLAGSHSTLALALAAHKPVIKIDPTGQCSPQIIQANRFGREGHCEPLTLASLQIALHRLVLFSSIFFPDNPRLTNEQLAKRNRHILDNAQHFFDSTQCLTSTNAAPDYQGAGPVSSGSPRLLNRFASSVYSGFKWLLSNREQQRQKRALLAEKSMADAPTSTLDSSQRPDTFYAHFLAMDGMAVRHGNVHRSTYLSIYLLAAIALLSAACGVVYKAYYGFVAAMIAVKALSLVAIYLLYKVDQHNHHKWLQSRCLAEAIRPNIYLGLLGRNFSFFDQRSSEEFMYREVLGHCDSGSQWICMHAEALSRHLGFAHCPLADNSYKLSAVSFLQQKWLAGQIDYHAGNAAQMKQFGERLSAITHGLFYSTCVAVVAKLAVFLTFPQGVVPTSSMWYAPAQLITVLTMLFPIVGTALFAIRNHAEFDISAQRSLTTLAFFNSMMSYFNKKRAQHNEHSSLPLDIDDGLTKLADASAQEVADWLEIYEVKESEPG